MAAVYGGRSTYAVPQMRQHLGDAALFLFSYPHYTKLFQNCNPLLGPLAQTHLPLLRCTAKYAVPIMFILGPLAQTRLPLLRCTANYVEPKIFIFIINHCNGATKATLTP